MGDRLMKLYEYAEKEGGLQTKMRLAMKTGVPSAKAATEPDSPDLIAKFKTAFKEVTGKDAPPV